MLVCEIQKDLRTDTLVSLGSGVPLENIQTSDMYVVFEISIPKYCRVRYFPSY